MAHYPSGTRKTITDSHPTFVVTVQQS